MRKANLANLADIKRIVNAGGTLEFTWSTGCVILIHPSGKRQAVDGRSYHAYVFGPEVDIERKEVGQVGDDLSGLIITWRRRQ